MLSAYKQTLDANALKRYNAKLQLISNVDPYEVPAHEWTSDARCLPSVTYPDIVNYTVFSHSAYTLEQMKCYKALDAHNQFTSGFVSKLSSLRFHYSNKIVVMAKVRHSQSVTSKKPLTPWVIAEPSGCIIAAHCDCVAGLGECCTHVASVLFAVDAAVRVEKNKTVTEEAAYWMLPSSISKVKHDSVDKIDFTSSRAKKRKLDNDLHNLPSPTYQKLTLPAVPQTSADELNLFFRELNLTDTKPAILSIVPEFTHNYIPKSLNTMYPWVSVDLKHEDCTVMCRQLLNEVCRGILDSGVLNISGEARRLVEENTRGQANDRMWFRFRAGRITASNVKKVCSTDPNNPALSTVKAICHPISIKTEATIWGCSHEKQALKAFEVHQHKVHQNLVIKPSGFVIHKDFSFIGASPDATVFCDCCGHGVVEVKCPFCVRDKYIIDALSKKTMPLKRENGIVMLRKEHAHFYQVQTQIFVCDVNYCDYVLWTEKEMLIERIEPDRFLWQNILEKCKKFFRLAVLPELVGGLFSRPQPSKVSESTAQDPAAKESCPSTSTEQIQENKCTSLVQASDSQGFDSTVACKEPQAAENVELFCVCQKPYDDSYDYIGCDNLMSCKFKWWHYKCAKIKKPPKGKWYCSVCRLLPDFKSITKQNIK